MTTRPSTDRLRVDRRGLTAADSTLAPVLARYGPGDWAWAIVTTTFACVPLGLSLWALLDAAHRPEWAWALAGRRRVVWIAGILFGILTLIGGLLISGYYLVSVRPQIAAAEEGDVK